VVKKTVAICVLYTLRALVKFAQFAVFIVTVGVAWATLTVKETHLGYQECKQNADLSVH